MNLFVTSRCPVECAKALDDVRLSKMILETTQMMAAAISINGGASAASYMPIAKTTGEPYRLTHVHHPVSKWIRASAGNYAWAGEHLDGLCREYLGRFNKTHYCHSQLFKIRSAVSTMPAGDRTAFCNTSAHEALPTIEAYRLTLNNKWKDDKILVKWTGATAPAWCSIRTWTDSAGTTWRVTPELAAELDAEVWPS